MLRLSDGLMRTARRNAVRARDQEKEVLFSYGGARYAIGTELPTGAQSVERRLVCPFEFDGRSFYLYLLSGDAPQT